MYEYIYTIIGAHINTHIYIIFVCFKVYFNTFSAVKLPLLNFHYLYKKNAIWSLKTTTPIPEYDLLSSSILNS